MGRFGKPTRVRLEIRLDPFLGVKLAFLYKERIGLQGVWFAPFVKSVRS
jgi:hypothetical protein